MSKYGLVLEGGGMRCLYTAGVLDFFNEHNIDFKDITAVSAGACNAISYITKQKGRNFEINSKFCKDKRYINPLGFFTKKGIFGLDFMFQDLPEVFVPIDYEAYKSSNTTLTVGITNVETAKAEYYDVKDIKMQTKYIIATSSLPFYSPMVEIDGKKYFDGGVVDSIPAKKAIEKGNDAVVVILTQNEGFVKKPNGGKMFYSYRYRKYPELVKAIDNRHIMYNNSLAYVNELEKQGKAFVLRPSKKMEVGRYETDPIKLKAVYQNGYDDAKDNYQKLMNFCKDAENVIK